MAIKFTGRPEIQRVVGEHTKNSRVSKAAFKTELESLKETIEKLEKSLKKK